MDDGEVGGDEIEEALGSLMRGEAGGADRLFDLLYEPLRRLAASRLRGEHVTLQPTAVVHEAWLRIQRGGERPFEGREHFLAVAARAIRHVLVDAARRRNAAKRGGDARGVTLVDVAVRDETTGEVDVLDLERALAALASVQPRHAQVVELRFFGGLTLAETAEVLGVSLATVKTDWAAARLFLARALETT